MSRTPRVVSALLVLTTTLMGCGDAKPTADRPVVAVAQISSLAPLDETRQGFYATMADSGFIADSTITYVERNAQGDISTLSLIMTEFRDSRPTAVATIASVTTQTALKVITDLPIVFGAVANPYVIGAGTSPTEHRPNVTGAPSTMQVDSAVVLAHEAFPAITTWGTLFDPADPFAEFYVELAKRGAAAAGVQFVTIPITSSSDVALAVETLKAKGVSGLVQIPSVMIGGAMPALVQATRNTGIALVSTITGYAGVPLSIGMDYAFVGREMALCLIRVLRGESPATIPFAGPAPRKVTVDLDAARAYGLTLPAAVVQQADSVIGAR